MTCGKQTWYSVHIFVESEADRFIFEYLAPFLIEAKRRRRIKRFFFVRSSQSGSHIRVRARSLAAISGSEFADEIRGVLAAFEREVVACGGRVEETTYDRAEAYFGETVASVYSELLNEYTSLLSIALFSGHSGQRAHIAAGVACALAIFLEQSNQDSQTARAALLRYREFALRVLSDASWQPIEIHPEAKKQFQTIIGRMIPATRFMLLHDRIAMHIVRLLRRASRLGRLGEFVATHSLHMFCNKNGIVPPHEYRLLEAVYDEL